MIFLIEYNRREGALITFREFDDSQKQEAFDARFELELDLYRRGVEHEVVLLEANSKEALRRTHLRYFESLGRMLELVAEGLWNGGTPCGGGA